MSEFHNNVRDLVIAALENKEKPIEVLGILISSAVSFIEVLGIPKEEKIEIASMSAEWIINTVKNSKVECTHDL